MTNDDTLQFTVMDTLVTVTACTVAWHTLRTTLSVSRTSESFVDVFWNRRDPTMVSLRNMQYSHMGLYHALIVTLSQTAIVFANRHVQLRAMVDTRIDPSEWNKQYGRQKMLAIFTTSYFLSDMVVIDEFPVYFWHHVISLFLLVVTLTIPSTMSVGSITLMLAEIGGVMLNVYHQFAESTLAYVLFVAVYGLSRMVLMYVVTQTTSNTFFLRVVHALLFFLALQNFWFLWQHVRKLPRKLSSP